MSDEIFAAVQARPKRRQGITCPASHPNLRDVRGELRCYR